MGRYFLVGIDGGDLGPGDLAIGALAAGAPPGAVVVAELHRRPFDAFPLAPRPVRGAPELTTRELQVLESIAAGCTVEETARALGIAPKTVRGVRYGLYRQIGAHDSATAMVQALRLGLIEAGGDTA